MRATSTPFLAAVLLAAALAAAPSAVQAHITANPDTAPADAYSAIAFRVGHPCANATLTNAVVMTIPEGVLSATAKMMPGWTVTTTRRQLTPPAMVHGKPMSDTVGTITWTYSGIGAVPAPPVATNGTANATVPAAVVGGIPDGQYEDFGVQFRAPALGVLKDDKAWFKVVQMCDAGRTQAWDMIGDKDADRPAPVVQLVKAPAAQASAGARSVGGLTVGIAGAVLAVGLMLV